MISIIATAHYGAVNGSLIYLCKSKDLQILEKFSPQGKIVLNPIETGKKMLLRNIQQKENGNLAMEMAFWQEEFIELVLVSTRFYLVIFVRLSVGLFTEMLNKQL